MKTKQQIAAAAIAVLILPVSVAFAASTPPSGPGAIAAARAETPAAVAARHAAGLRNAHVVHLHAVRRTVRLARSRARLLGRRATAHRHVRGLVDAAPGRSFPAPASQRA